MLNALDIRKSTNVLFHNFNTDLFYGYNTRECL